MSLPPPFGDGNGSGILERKWSEACNAIGVERGLAVKYYRKIWKDYGQYGRFYHTREHLRHMFSTLDKVRTHHILTLPQAHVPHPRNSENPSTLNPQPLTANPKLPIL